MTMRRENGDEKELKKGKREEEEEGEMR